MAQPDLTTVQKVKNYMRQQDIPAQKEQILQEFITIASRLVRRATKRNFTMPSETATIREFRTYGRHEVYIDELLSPADITSVVDENGFSVSYDLDFEEHRGPVRGVTLEFLPTVANGYGGIQGLPEDHADLFVMEWRPWTTAPIYPKKVVVTGNFGYEAIPEDIEFATRRAAALWYKEEIAHYTDDAFISRGRRFDPEELPPLSMAILRGAGWIVEDPVLV